MSPRRDESGAVALLTGVLAFVILAVAAFTIDFGWAYTNKRQLQTGADASALAAASYYTTLSGKCADINTSANKSAAQAIAQTYATKNVPTSSLSSFDVACPASGKPTVDVTLTGSTPLGLARLLTNSATLSANRSAQATVEVPPYSRGLRPYMLCSNDLPDPASTLPSGVLKVNFPTNGDSSANCPHSSGNWFTLDCPHTGNASNGNPDLADATLNGCSSDHPVKIVSPQDDSTPANLTTSLLAACPASATFATYDLDCLSANPGNLSAAGVIHAWDGLIALHKPITFPVFCGKPTCSPAAFSDVGGNNTLYPIYKLASAQVCGYHWGNKDSGTYVSTGPTDLCNGANAAPGTNSDNYLLLVFTHLQISGGLDESDCAPGDATCDAGLRSVRLTK